LRDVYSGISSIFLQYHLSRLITPRNAQCPLTMAFSWTASGMILAWHCDVGVWGLIITDRREPFNEKTAFNEAHFG